MDAISAFTLKIISGGQTGIDRAALDAALEHGVSVGGWCPEGRLAENGIIPVNYPLMELVGGGYDDRTKRNVLESDGTVIIYFDILEGGTKITFDYCVSLSKPHLLFDGLKIEEAKVAQDIATFVRAHDVHVLNFAGPRASKEPRGYAYAHSMMSGFLQLLGFVKLKS